MANQVGRNRKPGKMLLNKFDDKLRFFKIWRGHPRTIGSIMPTGIHLARSMASIIRPDSGLPVLELGPGTGTITRAILARGLSPEKLYAIEYTEEFLKKLLCEYSGVNFIHGDAFDLEAALDGVDVDKFDAVISALPLLNFPQAKRIDLLESLLDRLPPERPVIQFSYGARSPVPGNRGSYSIEHQMSGSCAMCPRPGCGSTSARSTEPVRPRRKTPMRCFVAPRAGDRLPPTAFAVSPVRLSLRRPHFSYRSRSMNKSFQASTFK